MFDYLRHHHLARLGAELVVLAAVTIVVVFCQQRPVISSSGQQVGSLVMLPATIPVDKALERRVGELLQDTSATTKLPWFVITNVDRRGDYQVVSVAGLPKGLEMDWTLDQAQWLGVVTVVDPSVDRSMPGFVEDMTAPTYAEGGTGVGGAGTILPFRSGTTAVYGSAGVHNCGFSLNGWKAVDLFPSENNVYSAEDGEVSYVCRDGTQVALRIGNYLYDHLVDHGQQVGEKVTQGQQLGSLVPGSFNATCGYADQQPTAFHVHWCFVPNGNGTFAADGYALNVNNQQWVKDQETVDIGGTLTATWQNANITPGPTAGGNFWDGISSGFMGLVGKVVPALPQHETMGLADKVMGQATAPMQLMYVMVFGIVDMTIPIFVFGVIMALEAARLIYAAYMFVKKAIPVIG
jgi:hypothetical protein